MVHNVRERAFNAQIRPGKVSLNEVNVQIFFKSDHRINVVLVSAEENGADFLGD